MTIRAIIFDMDGTLTESYINWPALRSKINCPPEKTIIEHIDNLPAKQREQANDILLQKEWEAAQHAAIRAGATELHRRTASAQVQTRPGHQQPRRRHAPCDQPTQSRL